MDVTGALLLKELKRFVVRCLHAMACSLFRGNHEVLQSGGLLGGGYLWVDGSKSWCGKRLMPRDLTKSNSLIKPGVLLGFHGVVVVASWTNGLCIGLLGLWLRFIRYLRVSSLVLQLSDSVPVSAYNISTGVDRFAPSMFLSIARPTTSTLSKLVLLAAP